MQRAILFDAIRCVSCATPLTRTLAAPAVTVPILRPQPHAALLTANRFCSSLGNAASGNSSHAPATDAATNIPSANAMATAASAPSVSLAETEEGMAPEVAAQVREWRERLKQLSSEDQALIIDALMNPEKQKASLMGGPGIGPKDADMAAAFTCGQCDYRMVKKFSKHAYTKGIVIVECPHCHVKHLLADNLGWVSDEATNIEDMLRKKGEGFVRIGSGDYQFVVGEREEAKGSK